MVLRGIVLNLFVIWLPIVTAAFVVLRAAYRELAYSTALDGKVWLQPLTFAAIAAAVFATRAVIYSFYSGWRAKHHEDMPYKSRQDFERVTPYVVGALALFLVLGSLPYVQSLVLHEVVSQGVVGFIMAAGGAALGLWSRFVPRGDSADKAPAWVGPVGAAFVIYGIGLLAYALSGTLFCANRVTPNDGPLAAMIVIALFSICVGYFVDSNETTLHRFYRDRLMEAFMPDIDTDGVPTGRRACAADAGRLRDMCDPSDPKGPYHLICAHLVLTRIDKRGVSPRWLDR